MRLKRIRRNMKADKVVRRRKGTWKYLKKVKIWNKHTNKRKSGRSKVIREQERLGGIKKSKDEWKKTENRNERTGKDNERTE